GIHGIHRCCGDPIVSDSLPNLIAPGFGPAGQEYATKGFFLLGALEGHYPADTSGSDDHDVFLHRSYSFSVSGFKSTEYDWTIAGKIRYIMPAIRKDFES